MNEFLLHLQPAMLPVAVIAIVIGVAAVVVVTRPALRLALRRSAAALLCLAIEVAGFSILVLVGPYP